MNADATYSFPVYPAKSRLYRQFFTPEEIRRLDGTPPDSLTSEIYLIRTLLRRVLALSGEGASSDRRRSLRQGAQGPLTLKQRLSMLAAFCQAALILASLVRFEFKQQPEPPSLVAQWAAAYENEPL